MNNNYENLPAVQKMYILLLWQQELYRNSGTHLCFWHLECASTLNIGYL